MAEAKFPGDAVPLAGRAHVLGRRNGKHAARQQQCLLSRSELTWAQLEARRAATRAAGLHAERDRPAENQPGLPTAKVLPRSLDPRTEERDIKWYGADGKEMTDETWNSRTGHGLGLYLDGEMIGEFDSHNDPIRGEGILLLFNAHTSGEVQAATACGRGGLDAPVGHQPPREGGRGDDAGRRISPRGSGFCRVALDVEGERRGKADVSRHVAAELTPRCR